MTDLINMQISNSCDKVVFDVFKQMTDIEPERVNYRENNLSEIEYDGIISIVSFTGEKRGRIILGIQKILADYITLQVYGKFNPTNDEVLEVISELNNIISGNIASEYKQIFGLIMKVTPPSIFFGRKIIVSTAQITNSRYDYLTSYGTFFLNVGFERG